MIIRLTESRYVYLVYDQLIYWEQDNNFFFFLLNMQMSLFYLISRINLFLYYLITINAQSECLRTVSNKILLWYLNFDDVSVHL